MEVLHDMLDQIERQRLSKMVSEMPEDDTLTDTRFVYRVEFIGSMVTDLSLFAYLV